MIDRVVYLLGYTKEGSHTNWYHGIDFTKYLNIWV